MAAVSSIWRASYLALPGVRAAVFTRVSSSETGTRSLFEDSCSMGFAVDTVHEPMNMKSSCQIVRRSVRSRCRDGHLFYGCSLSGLHSQPLIDLPSRKEWLAQ